jgi:hypothetical protein
MAAEADLARLFLDAQAPESVSGGGIDHRVTFSFSGLWNIAGAASLIEQNLERRAGIHLFENHLGSRPTDRAFHAPEIQGRGLSCRFHELLSSPLPSRLRG